jgi:hypothetical protein
MAADRDIKIKFTTTADLTGAQAAADAVEEVTEAAQEASGFGIAPDLPAQREQNAALADEAALRGEVADATAEQIRGEVSLEDVQAGRMEALQQAEEDLREIRRRAAEEEVDQQIRAREALATRVAVVAAIGATIVKSLREASQQIREVTDEAAAAGVQLSAGSEALAATLEQIADPVGAVFDVISSGARESLTALAASEKQAKELAAAYEEMQRAREDQVRAAKVENLERVFARENALIDEGTAALNRQLRVLRARRDAADAEARLGDAVAAAGGTGDDTRRGAAEVTRRAGNEEAAVRETLEQAEQLFQAALDRERTAVGALAEAVSSLGANSEEALAARAAVDAAGAAAADAQAELETVRAEADAQLAAISAGAQAELVRLGADVLTEAKAQADATIALLKAQAEEQGGQLSSEAQQQMNQLVQIVRDGLVTEDELGPLRQTMELLRSSQEARDAAIFGTLQSMLADLDATRRKYEELKAQVDRQRRAN